MFVETKVVFSYRPKTGDCLDQVYDPIRESSVSHLSRSDYPINQGLTIASAWNWSSLSAVILCWRYSQLHMYINNSI